MAKIKPLFTIKSYGLYTEWEHNSRELPKIIKHTHEICAKIGVEFGFILLVKKAKGEMLEYCIEHPPFTDEEGEVVPPFKGVYFVNSNNFQFFLGDTIWEPIENKRGEWILTVRYKGEKVACETFHLY